MTSMPPLAPPEPPEPPLVRPDPPSALRPDPPPALPDPPPALPEPPPAVRPEPPPAVRPEPPSAVLPVLPPAVLPDPPSALRPDPPPALPEPADQPPAPPEPAVGRPGHWHDLLLELAGRMPDDLLSAARFGLAEGDYDNVALSVAVASITAATPVTPVAAYLVLTQLFAAGEDLEQLPPLVVAEPGADPLAWLFAPVPVDAQPEPEPEPEPEVALDLTEEGARPTLDRIDAAAVETAASLPGVRALWRTWRHDRTMSGPRRIFIGFAEPETEADDLPGLTATLQAALIDAGDVHPQVEFGVEEHGFPEYQSRARANAALLWAAEPATPIRSARVYDGVDPERGPWFAPDHPTLDDEDERRRIIAALRAAAPVLTTTQTMLDVVEPEKGDVVPLTCRTDGRWVWPDMVAYYLEQYRLAPERDLLAHLRATPPRRSVISAVGRHRALAALQRGD